MDIWHAAIDLIKINDWSAGTAVEHLGIDFVAFGPDWLSATMPVDRRNVGPEGIEDLVTAAERDADGADLRDHRIRVDRGAPEAALRALETKELAVENDGRLHNFPQPLTLTEVCDSLPQR